MKRYSSKKEYLEEKDTHLVCSYDNIIFMHLMLEDALISVALWDHSAPFKRN